MCESTDVIKQDGLFVCQSCGTRYSVEEAKKIMFGGTVDVSGSSVKIDVSDSVKNYMELAENSYSYKLYGEAETYCNKVLESDPKNLKAWLLKGKAIGWGSGIANARLDEVVLCYINVLQNCGKDQLPTYFSSVYSEWSSFTFSLVSSACNYFVQTMNAVAYGYVTDITNKIVKYNSDICVWQNKNPSDMIDNLAILIGNAGTKVWEIIRDGKPLCPDEDEWKLFVERADLSMNMLAYSNYTSRSDIKNKVIRYKTMILIQSETMGICSYIRENDGYRLNHGLPNEDKERRINLIMDWHTRIRELDPDYVIPPRPSIHNVSGIIGLVTGSVLVISCLLLGLISKTVMLVGIPFAIVGIIILIETVAKYYWK